jgi:hypothetical protein
MRGLLNHASQTGSIRRRQRTGWNASYPKGRCESPILIEALVREYREILKNGRGAGVMLGFDVVRVDPFVSTWNKRFGASTRKNVSDLPDGVSLDRNEQRKIMSSVPCSWARNGFGVHPAP